MKYHRYGKDQETLPCVELDDLSVYPEGEILLALIEAFLKKGLLKIDDVKGELV